MKKLHIKSITSLILALIMIFSIIPLGTIESNAAGGVKAKLDAFMKSYPSGGRWTGSFDGGIQCYGFGKMAMYNVFGKVSSGYRHWKYDGTPTRGMQQIGSITSFSSSNVKSLLSKAKCGDILQFNTPKQHTMIVYSVESDGVRIYDCNWDNNCGISLRKSSFGAWSGRNSTKLTLLRADNYSSVDGSATHTHSYSGSYFEAAHPHRVYQKCSCGATKYTGATKYVSTCSQCTMKADSKYNTVKGFKAYPCVSSDFEVKTSDLTTRGGEIYTTDFCTVNELYTNGWCKVTFPMDSGGTRTAYTKISNFIKTPSASLTKYTATEYINLYSTSSLSTQIYRIYPGDVCYTIGKSGSATQIFMPMSGKGYYVLGWAVLPPAQESCGYDVPFKCRTISTTKVKCYNDINFTSSPGYIYPTDDCVITAVYSNGKVKVSCPWSDGTTKTVYVNKSVFINSSSTPKNMMAPKYAKTYLRTDMGTNIGWIDEGNKIQVVATSGSKSQIIYPADVGKRCAWVNTSDLTQTYTITFNANGGTGAPAKQTKTHGTDLKLSTTKPTRTGYTFVGWATSASATSATYAAGSVYTKDVSDTLYAVWRKQSYTIAFNANGGQNAPGVQTQTYGTAITLTDEQPDKTYTVTFDAAGGTSDTSFYSLDCSFSGWNTSKDGTGTAVQSGASYKPNANVTLYAIYSNPVLGTYPIPEKEGHVFNGWYTAASGGTKVNADSVISADTTLYAQWDLETYSVIYFDDGSANLPKEQTKTYGTPLTLSAQTPTKEGYSFKGWSVEEGSAIVAYLPGATYTNEDSVLLYPVWEKNAVTLTGISISKAPTKTVYALGEPLDVSGLELKLTYSDGSTELVTNGFSVQGFESETAGTKTITVTYGGKTTSFSVTVEKAATNTPQYQITSAVGTAGSTVEIYISIQNNPGIISLRNTVSYDTEALELLKVEDCKLLAGYTVPSSTISSPYTLRWADSLATENNTANGRIVKLTFQIKETAAEGFYNIAVTPVEARTVDGAKIAFDAASSTIQVAKYKVGDVDGDGEVNDWDAILLNRYLAGWAGSVALTAADVDGDGEVSDWDAIVLERYLAGWNVSLGKRG